MSVHSYDLPLCTVRTTSLWTKVTIGPGFSGTVPIFNDVSWEKNHSSPGTPICPVFSKRQRITLRLLYAISRPSVVCCLSVCDVGAPYSGG